MTVTGDRALRAFESSVRLAVPELVAQLQALLGARLVAYIGGVRESRAVRQWAAGERAPGEAAVARLRLAYRAAKLLSETDSTAVVQAWFQGQNPHLEEVSPARRLRDGDPDDAGPAVVAAAKAFAAHG